MNYTIKDGFKLGIGLFLAEAVLKLALISAMSIVQLILGNLE